MASARSYSPLPARAKPTATSTTLAAPFEFNNNIRYVENYDEEEKKTIFLTFDDGPVGETKRVVELLKVGCKSV